MPPSEFNKDYDWVNDLLKKQLFDKIDLKHSEASRLEYFLDKFVKTDCDYDGACLCRGGDTCRFNGIPDEWVKLFGFDNLCNLILNYIVNDRQLKKRIRRQAKQGLRRRGLIQTITQSRVNPSEH